MFRNITKIAVVSLAAWTGSANAALIGTCTYSGGCGPDFFSSGTVNFVTDGDGGTLTLETTTGNASFLSGQLDASFEGDYGLVSHNVIWMSSPNPADDTLSLSIEVDGSGNLIGGSLDMNGRVVAIDGGIVQANAANGQALNGALIDNGVITQIGWNHNTIDFRGIFDAGSILNLADYGDHMAGVLSLSGINSGSGDIEWNESWSATGNLDVVIPVPAAVWLFASGLIGLVGLGRKKALS